MDEILSDVISPHWWVTVVGVGIVSSILANRLPDWVGRLSARTGAAWVQRQEQRRIKHEQTIDQLARDPQRRIELKRESIRLSISSVLCLLPAETLDLLFRPLSEVLLDTAVGSASWWRRGSVAAAVVLLAVLLAVVAFSTFSRATSCERRLAKAKQRLGAGQQQGR